MTLTTSPARKQKGGEIMKSVRYTPAQIFSLCLNLVIELQVADGVSRRLFTAQNNLNALSVPTLSEIQKAERQLLKAGMLEHNVIEGRIHGEILSEEGYQTAINLFGLTAQEMFLRLECGL